MVLENFQMSDQPPIEVEAKVEPAKPRRRHKAKRPWAKNPPKDARGRPTSYRVEFARLAKKMALMGATDVDLAEAIGVDEDTIVQWKRTQPSFIRALKAGKEDSDYAVAHSLYKQALGYRVKAEKAFVIDGKIVTREYYEFIQPSAAAAIFWLKNRRSKFWRADPMVSLEVNDQTLKLPAAIIEEARRIARGEEEP